MSDTTPSSAEDGVPLYITSADAIDDRVVPFAVPALDIRGRVIRLGEALNLVLDRHAYPDAVSRVLGEAATLTVLLGTALKFEGRFQLQTKTDGAISMLVVDFTAPDQFRAVARFDAEKLAAAGQTGTAALLGHGHLAMTVDQGAEMSRYQGVVALEGQGLEEAAHQYFRQSEQIPTRIRLAVGEVVTGGRRHWRGGALMVQFMPQSADRMRAADLPPGDAPEGSDYLTDVDGDGVRDDAWMEARSLVGTIEDHELLDPALASESLLYRLFHERGARVFEAQAVHEECRCSRERIMGMLKGFSAKDRYDMIADDGQIGITCEFCSRRYEFDPAQVEAEVGAGK
ncbi:MAG: Hsp33 family molecular chaperone [Bosea sp. (in: a-proteobacteria)]